MSRKHRAPKSFTDVDPSASIYDGRRLLGFLVDEPTQCAALDPDRFLIGLFPDRKHASHAIIDHHRRLSQVC